MAPKAKSSSARDRRNKQAQSHQVKNDNDQVYRITGASESVIADSERKNRIYAMLIGVRIVSLFVVLATDGWVQIAVFITGMLAPWIGVQIANTIRQVDGRSIEVIPPQQAALEAASLDDADDQEAGDGTVIVGDVVVDDQDSPTHTPSAESDANDVAVDQDKKDNDDTGP